MQLDSNARRHAVSGIRKTFHEGNPIYDWELSFLDDHEGVLSIEEKNVALLAAALYPYVIKVVPEDYEIATQEEAILLKRVKEGRRNLVSRFIEDEEAIDRVLETIYDIENYESSVTKKYGARLYIQIGYLFEAACSRRHFPPMIAKRIHESMDIPEIADQFATYVNFEYDHDVDKFGPVIERLPGKQKSKLIILRYIADQFKDDVEYDEQQVNFIIQGNIADNDVASIRRAFIEYGFFTRSKDGKTYKKVK